jgi:hypothetical protein
MAFVKWESRSAKKSFDITKKKPPVHHLSPIFPMGCYDACMEDAYAV